MTTIEQTDTFGREANYSWVKRWNTKKELTNLQLVRLAKKLAGLTGVRCRREDMGDLIALYPVGYCQVIFIGYSESEEFGNSLDD